MNIKKQELIKVYNFLNGASLVGAVSRARTKLNKFIAEALQEMQSDESDLVKEYGGEILQGGAVKFGKMIKWLSTKLCWSFTKSRRCLQKLRKTNLTV